MIQENVEKLQKYVSNNKESVQITDLKNIIPNVIINSITKMNTFNCSSPVIIYRIKVSWNQLILIINYFINLVLREHVLLKYFLHMKEYAEHSLLPFSPSSFKIKWGKYNVEEEGIEWDITEDVKISRSCVDHFLVL